MLDAFNMFLLMWYEAVFNAQNNNEAECLQLMFNLVWKNVICLWIVCLLIEWSQCYSARKYNVQHLL